MLFLYLVFNLYISLSVILREKEEFGKTSFSKYECSLLIGLNFRWTDNRKNGKKTIKWKSKMWKLLSHSEQCNKTDFVCHRLKMVNTGLLKKITINKAGGFTVNKDKPLIPLPRKWNYIKTIYKKINIKGRGFIFTLKKQILTFF